MKTDNLYYPAALILIILIAGYLLYASFFQPRTIDYAKYLAVCTQYRDAPAGRYTHAEMQMLVNEINYALPQAVTELSVPAERELKDCARQLADRLNVAK